eukprot:CAMPEP_0206471886 /NCGR_PEP_ID=MMETSP0324_2-20121206/31846_1 /ASSEMBLY_ACC=CAM_ASM_000836 /TAXON_ID=2866 /ORGANISM="Crypthecodinium cohnii, Strain Seligo" /LENGTH=72 /DNA_ID=CAMNT_0053946329 /DNA_START=152 /DNA_END=367 /DNA_ORIENTATION=-
MTEQERNKMTLAAASLEISEMSSTGQDGDCGFPAAKGSSWKRLRFSSLCLAAEADTADAAVAASAAAAAAAA